jgi:FdhD protein
MPFAPEKEPVVSDGSLVVDREAWLRDGIRRGTRVVPEETALALTYNGGTYAVMMGTPRDLEDFAVGFSLGEGIVESADEIDSLEIVQVENGIELRMWLAADRAERLNERRRLIIGPTGCGLCGTDSIAEATRSTPVVVSDATFSFDQIMEAMRSIAAQQTLNATTRAVHAAAFWTREDGIVSVKEDVGRHNALDKLVGALLRSGIHAGRGMVLLTSRVSIELVQKTATLGSPLMVAVSVPTALAVRAAETAGITLVAIARDDGFEVFTHPHRVVSLL